MIAGQQVTLEVTIEQCTDDEFPGWVQGSFVDALGRQHQFHEKAPILALSPVRWQTLPAKGSIRCTVVCAEQSNQGDRRLQVDTRCPDGIETIDGQHRFWVMSSQVSS